MGSDIVTAVEPKPPAYALDGRVLVLAPTGDDAAILASILEEQSLNVIITRDANDLARELFTGADVLLITSEALESEESRAVLRDVFDRQEAWSELPVLLFGGSSEDKTARLSDILGSRIQPMLLERPLGIATVVTATRSALRTRRRQYEVRQLLHELEESAVRIARVSADADRAKDEFLATLGHELRSPMTAIRGWIQMLIAGDLEPEETASALAMIESSTRVQAHIIEDLMDVSRIIAGKVMIEPAIIELAPVVEQIVATFRPAAASQGIEISAEVPAETLTVWADGARLQQVGWNLVSNAIKFTPEGGSVRVSLERRDQSAVMRIRDTGEGIGPDLLPHVFDRYRQGTDGAKKKSHGGLGLGLAIVEHLVKAHGGSIEAVSEGPGKGAEFVVTLPLYQP